MPSADRGDTEIAADPDAQGHRGQDDPVKQTVPHAYTVVEVDMGNVVRWREANNVGLQGA